MSTVGARRPVSLAGAVASWFVVGAGLALLGVVFVPPLLSLTVLAVVTLRAAFVTRGRGALVGIASGAAVATAGVALAAYISMHGFTTPVAVLVGALLVSSAVIAAALLVRRR